MKTTSANVRIYGRTGTLCMISMSPTQLMSRREWKNQKALILCDLTLRRYIVSRLSRKLRFNLMLSAPFISIIVFGLIFSLLTIMDYKHIASFWR